MAMSLEEKRRRDRARFRHRTYGLTEEDYQELIARHSDRCAICNKHSEENGGQALAIDHCHTTEQVRGLLCRECNLGLGYFHDNINLLSDAIKYLNRNASDH